MSVKTDAETIIDLAHKIVQFEILKLQFQQNGGTIQIIPDNPDTAVPLTAQQRQTVLAIEDGWKTQIKALAAGL